MFKTIKKLFHRHQYEFVEEQTIQTGFTNVLGFKDGKPTSSIKDIRYGKIKIYKCKTCGYMSTKRG